MQLVKIISVVLLVCLAKANSQDIQNQGVRALIRVYDECSKSDDGFTSCLKKRAVQFIDRVARVDTINFGDVKISRSDEVSELPKPLSDNELEQTLPRGLEARDDALNNMLIERVASMFSTRTVQFTLPKVSSDEIGRGLEEGRGKMKKMMSMMMMGFMMKMAAMVPLAIAGLYILAGKALIVSKIALLLAGIIGLKKLLASKQSQGHSSDAGGWSAGSRNGWDRRSIEAAQNIAYRGYSKQ